MSLTTVYNQIRGALGLGRAFPPAQEPSLSSHNTKFATATYIYKPIVDELSGLIAKSHAGRIPGGRLTLESGVPVSTTDQTAKTTIYYTPYSHQSIQLWDTTLKNWIAYPFAEISLALGTLTSARPYDVFAYLTSGSITAATNATPIVVTSTAHGLSNGDLLLITGVEGNYAANGFRKVANQATNTFELQDLDGNNIAGNGTYTTGGTWYKVAIEALAWTSDTARATVLARQDGIWCKTGALDRRYLGTFRTTSTTTTEDSKKSRLVINHYNRVQRKLRAHDGTNSWTSTTNAFEAWNGGTTLGTGRVDALFPSPSGDNFARFSFGGSSSNTSTRLSTVGIGVDSTTVNSATKIIGAESTTLAPSCAFYSEYPSLGYHYFQMLQRPGNAGTTTFAGDGGVDYLFSSLEGEVWG